MGPLSGIEAALASGRAERNLVLACDTPGVDLRHLRQLLLQDNSCVITEDESGRLHPLCAVYDVSCLPAIRAALDAGRLKLLDLAASLSPAILRYPGVLSNINTLEDLAAARQ
jgi:molybdopterin-guanine dinucleotide biosynthesis protein A